MKENLIKLLSQEKILPILRSNDADTVINWANALIDGGVKIIEINAQNPSIYKAISEISKHATVCAGGIITAMQAEASIESGVKISKDKEIPYIAETSTANEAYNAWKARIPLIKIYPITAMGGAMYVEDLLRPMPFLNVMPLGSVKLDEVHTYIKAGATCVGVGRDFYDGYSLSEITSRAKRVLSELKG